MKGSGYYNENSAAQADLIHRQRPLLYQATRAAARALKPLPSVVHIADLGETWVHPAGLSITHQSVVHVSLLSMSKRPIVSRCYSSHCCSMNLSSLPPVCCQAAPRDETASRLSSSSFKP